MGLRVLFCGVYWIVPECFWVGMICVFDFV